MSTEDRVYRICDVCGNECADEVPDDGDVSREVDIYILDYLAIVKPEEYPDNKFIISPEWTDESPSKLHLVDLCQGCAEHIDIAVRSAVEELKEIKNANQRPEHDGSG